MNNEQLAKITKAAAALLALMGIQFGPEQLDAFTTATGTVLTGIFAVVYALEAWWKRKK